MAAESKDQEIERLRRELAEKDQQLSRARDAKQDFRLNRNKGQTPTRAAGLVGGSDG